MITKTNLRPLLAELGFIQNPLTDCYTKEFPEYGDCIMKVDFTNNHLVYPTAILGRERNTSFDKPENFGSSANVRGGLAENRAYPVHEKL